MSLQSEATISIRVDPTNPGQFLACCGLLELADRLWKGAEGWFERDRVFLLRPTRPETACTPAVLLEGLARCPLTNTMTNDQLLRREELAGMPRPQREADPSLEAEKKALDALWREAPIHLLEPVALRVDWFRDDRAGGSSFKTWAGQQSVLDIARGMKSPLEAGLWDAVSPHEWLSKRVPCDAALPFHLDSDIGGIGSARDVGFSIDPLKTIRVQPRPLLELLAFVGLQRFRPKRVRTENRFRFFTWADPLMPEVAAGAACGLVDVPTGNAFEFRLFYRTKYLKSFLPAQPIGGKE